MIPESSQANAIRLYKSTNFPEKWEYVQDIIPGRYVDTSIVNQNGIWYLFTGELHRALTGTSKDLHLFYSENLTGPWFEHPMSPIVRNDPNRARPGGRIIESYGIIYRIAQDDTPLYGNGLRILQITELTTQTYREEEISSIGFFLRNPRWAILGVHTFDTDGNICVYDGRGW
ncbi:MAG: hypothetical protein QXY45_01315 [Candidatus Aenigmatarchaeota archaeon]